MIRSAAIATLLLTLAVGCGSSGGNDSGVASAGGGNARASSAPSADPTNDPLKFAQCMRSHGVDVPDPDPNSGGYQALAQAVRKAPKNKRNAALNACQKYVGGVIAEKNSPKFQQELVKYVDCLQKNGADISDPDPSTGRLPKDSAQKLAHPDATTQKAKTACAGELPGSILRGNK
jgi:hypothetical protein